MDKLMTHEELQAFLKVSRKTIDNLREKGLPCFKVGRQIRFDKEKVLEWLKEKN